MQDTGSLLQAVLGTGGKWGRLVTNERMRRGTRTAAAAAHLFRCSCSDTMFRRLAIMVCIIVLQIKTTD